MKAKSQKKEFKSVRLLKVLEIPSVIRRKGKRLVFTNIGHKFLGMKNNVVNMYQFNT
jgi:hypothetical protein